MHHSVEARVEDFIMSSRGSSRSCGRWDNRQAGNDRGTRQRLPVRPKSAGARLRHHSTSKLADDVLTTADQLSCILNYDSPDSDASSPVTSQPRPQTPEAASAASHSGARRREPVKVFGSLAAQRVPLLQTPTSALGLGKRSGQWIPDQPSWTSSPKGSVGSRSSFASTASTFTLPTTSSIARASTPRKSTQSDPGSFASCEESFKTSLRKFSRLRRSVTTPGKRWRSDDWARSNVETAEASQNTRRLQRIRSQAARRMRREWNEAESLLTLLSSLPNEYRVRVQAAIGTLPLEVDVDTASAQQPLTYSSIGSEKCRRQAASERSACIDESWKYASVLEFNDAVKLEAAMKRKKTVRARMETRPLVASKPPDASIKRHVQRLQRARRERSEQECMQYFTTGANWTGTSTVVVPFDLRTSRAKTDQEKPHRKKRPNKRKKTKKKKKKLSVKCSRRVPVYDANGHRLAGAYQVKRSPRTRKPTSHMVPHVTPEKLLLTRADLLKFLKAGGARKLAADC